MLAYFKIYSMHAYRKDTIYQILGHKGVLYRDWWNCRNQRKRTAGSVKSCSYQSYQVDLCLYTLVFNISYAEDIKDIYTDKEQQQKCYYSVGAVPIYMICIPDIYRFVKALIFNLPPAVADTYSIF